MRVLLSRLPVTSAFMEARLNDPETAHILAAHAPDEDAAPGRPGLREFTPDIALMTQMVELLQGVISGLHALGGGKPPKVVPLLRPLTEVDRLRANVEKRRHLELVDEVKAAQERWAASRELPAPR